MKKIGILHGMERSFPEAFIARVNSKNIDGITAEAVRIDKVAQAYPTEYAVIIDRISQDDPFFNNCLAIKIGVPVPKTVILPSYQHPDETSKDSFSNLASPLDWEGMLSYIGFPAFMKPYAGGGWKHVYKIHDSEELFARHAETGKLVMMLQEAIEFDSYFRCYCVGGKYVRSMHYEP